MHTALDHSFQVCDISVPLNPRNPMHIHEICRLNIETRVEIEEIMTQVTSQALLQVAKGTHRTYSKNPIHAKHRNLPQQSRHRS